MKVQKFGGTSVGSPQRIREVASLITSSPGKNIVVLSAMSGTTNSLLEISAAIEKGDKNLAEENIRNLEKKYQDVVEELFQTPDAKKESKYWELSKFSFSMPEERLPTRVFCDLWRSSVRKKAVRRFFRIPR